MAPMTLWRSATGIRRSALAALALILIEKITFDVCPVEHRVGRILQTLQGKMKILQIVEVVLDRLADNLRTGALEAARRTVEFLEERVG